MMEAAGQDFLDAEEKSKQLVEQLQKLHEQASSYQSATAELDAVRQRVAEFVQETGAVARATHEAVTVLRAIGGPEILSRLNALNETLEGPDVAGRLAALEKTAVGPGILDKIDEARSVVHHDLSQLCATATRNGVLIAITLTAALAALAMSIIAVV